MAFIKRKQKMENGAAGPEIEVEAEWHDHWYTKVGLAVGGVVVGREAQRRGWLGGGAGADLDMEMDLDMDA